MTDRRLPMPRFARARCAMLLPLALVLAIALAACDSPPRGDTAGRMGATDTHEAEAASPEILPAALIEFSDQVPRRLAQDLAELPRLRDAEGRATVIFGDINNRTGIVSSNDFEMMMRRMRSNLINAPAAKEHLRFVEDRGRMKDLAQRERVASDQGRVADPPNYDPATSYTLNGNFFRVARRGVNLYYMDIELSHFDSNEIVFSDRYEIKRAAD